MALERFHGFPVRMDFTAVPTMFLTMLMPDIEDLNELKVTLHIMHLLYHKKGSPRFVSYSELAADRALLAGLKGDGPQDSRWSLRRSLELARQRGTIIAVNAERAGRTEEFFLLNTEAGYGDLERILRGELAVQSITGATLPPGPPPPRQNVFTLYERNIGVLTPMVAEELRSAEKEYPADWIEDAFREAVALNKRSWRYIARILEKWTASGRDSGKPGGHSKAPDSGRYRRAGFGRPIRH